jgi:hypothetical protein
MKKQDVFVWVEIMKCMDCGTLVPVAKERKNSISGYRLTGHKCSGSYRRGVLVELRIPAEYLRKRSGRKP